MAGASSARPARTAAAVRTALGARRQLDTCSRGGLSIFKRRKAQALRAEFDAGDIAQNKLGAVAFGAQDNRLELLGRLQLPPRSERDTDFLSGKRCVFYAASR